MKYLSIFIVMSLFCIYSHTVLAQSGQSLPSSSEGFDFKANLKATGSAFYAMNRKNGQVYFMLDYGEASGSWSSYGQTITDENINLFQFDIIERPQTTSFYALDRKTGKLYYTGDSGETAGQWNEYGNLIAKEGLNLLQFEVLGRMEGNSFYALDDLSGQMYYMNDFGEEAGQWNKYGGLLK